MLYFAHSQHFLELRSGLHTPVQPHSHSLTSSQSGLIILSPHYRNAILRPLAAFLGAPEWFAHTTPAPFSFSHKLICQFSSPQRICTIHQSSGPFWIPIYNLSASPSSSSASTECRTSQVRPLGPSSSHNSPLAITISLGPASFHAGRRPATLRVPLSPESSPAFFQPSSTAWWPD